MPGANGGKHLLCGNGASGTRLHRIADANNFFAQPPLDGRITFLQCSQSGPYSLAAGSAAAGCTRGAYVTSLLRGQTESSLFR